MCSYIIISFLSKIYTKKKSPPEGRHKKRTWQLAIVASSHYRRRYDASLPCSGWERVCPSCYRRQILEGSLKTRYVISTTLYSLQSWPSPRPISTAPLSTSLRLHSRPINLVVFEGPYLSPMGGLILEGASRLDAFSAYPVRTWLPSCATGVTTGAPSVRPPRSSRTRGSSPQTSCAHDR